MTLPRPAQRRAWLWPALFLACLAGAIARSLALGKDANWDLKNYHWYNAWALSNGRLGWDLAPAQLQTYHNPLGDLPFYALVQWLQDPRHIAACMAVSTAIGAFFLLRTLALLFPRERERSNLLLPTAAAVIGLSGASSVSMISSTMNEWPSAALTMAALWLAVRAAVQGEERRRWSFAAAGFLVGCAVGLKLTYGVFGVGLLAACAAFGTPRQRLRRAALTGAFAAAGFLACYAWWGWALWREFGNPFFPYFNSIFQSPWWQPVDFFDRNFGPRDWKQWLFFPLYFARGSLLVSEVGFRDYRLAVLLVLALLAWFRWRLGALGGKREPIPAAWALLAVFTLASYVVWIKLYAVYRYLVPLELVSGPLIVALLAYLLRGLSWRGAAAILLAGLLLGTTRPASWGRVAFGASYFEISVPDVPPRSLVIVGYAHPMAYAIPFFRPDARFVSPWNNFLAPDQRNRLAARIAQVVRDHNGPVFLLQHRNRDSHDERTAAHFGLEFDATPCLPVPSTFDANAMQLCRLARRGP